MVMRPDARIAAPALIALTLAGCASGAGSALSAKDPGFASVEEDGGRARLASGAGAAAGGGNSRGGPLYVSGNVLLPHSPARSGRPGAAPSGVRAVASTPLTGAASALSAPAVNADVSLQAGRLADARLALGPNGARADLAVGDPLAGVGRKGALRLTGGRPAGAGGLGGAAADATGSLIGAGKGATSAAANDNAADRLLRKALRKAKRTGLIGG